MKLAQVVETVQTVGSNTGLLSTILSGTLIAAVITGYRFVVNLRKTERGLTRARIRQANANERAAQHEASLWQNRAADLEYLLRKEGYKPPPLSAELKKLLSAGETAEDQPEDGKTPGDERDPTTGGRSGP